MKTGGVKFCTNPVILDRKDAREVIWKYFEINTPNFYQVNNRVMGTFWEPGVRCKQPHHNDHFDVSKEHLFRCESLFFNAAQPRVEFYAPKDADWCLIVHRETGLI